MHKLDVRGDPYALSLEAGDFTKVGGYLRVVPFAQQPYPLSVAAYDEEGYTLLKQRKFSRQIGYHMFLGAGVFALLFLMVFALVQYLENRRRSYLFYGLYVFCMALYFGRILEYHYEVPVFWGFFYEGYGLAEIVALMLSLVMYVMFARTFLDLDRHTPELRTVLRGWIGLCLVMALSGLALSVLQIHWTLFWTIHSVLKVLLLLLVFWFLWRIARAAIPFSRYVIWGTGFLIVGSLLAMLVTFVLRDHRGQVTGEPMFYMLAGALLEALCFALGLGRQARQDELDRIAAQQEVIRHLERERILEHEVQESRIQALRAQMNPHFIFNALNSIQHFVLSNQKEKSVRYLTRFSRLIRRILQNSNERQISLSEEIETLKTYVEIEQLRFHPSFSFEMHIQEGLSTEDIAIPHLVIQPFVENAILHGLAPLKGEGKLSISIEQSGGKRLQVTVEDNGIGRAAAAGRDRRVGDTHESISIRSITDRLQIMMPDVLTPVAVDDLHDPQGNPAGTRVTVLLPIIER